MNKLKKALIVVLAIYFIIGLINSHSLLSNALADSTNPLIIVNNEGEHETIGTLNVTSNNSFLIITFDVKPGYELYSSEVNLRFNSDGILRALSSGRGRDDYIVVKEKTKHQYNIPWSGIKNDGVQIWAGARVVSGENMFQTRKAVVSVTTTTLPPTTTTTGAPITTTTIPTTTTTTEATTTTTTVPSGGGGGGGGTTTTAPSGGGTTTTVAGGTTTTSTTVAGITTTTVLGVTTTLPQIPTTTVEVAGVQIKREQLPFTGINYNWYLIGFLLTLAGIGIYLGSVRE